MNNLEDRIKKLEKRTGGQDTIREPSPDTDSLIRKMGFDPEKVRATAKANESSLAEVMATELGMSVKEFRKALRRGARDE